MVQQPRSLRLSLEGFSAPLSASFLGWLQALLRIVHEKLALSEAREEAHQSHWAQEVDRLRQKVLSLEPQIYQARLIRESYELLRQQLQAAEQRAARFEEQLLAMQEAESEGPLISGTRSESLAGVSSIK